MKSSMLQVLTRTDTKMTATIVGGLVASTLKAFKCYNREDMIEISKMIIQENKKLKIEELALLLKKGVLGRYGKIYGNLTIADVFEWIEKFLLEKDQFLEGQHEARKNGLNPTQERTMTVEKAFKVLPTNKFR